MARRGMRYLLKRIRQIAVLSIGTAIFFGLCFASLTQAQNEAMAEVNKKVAADPSKVMQVLMQPAGAPIDRCLVPENAPAVEKCRAFFNVDNEEVLENLLQNYTRCLDGHSYYYDFSNQPVVKLSHTIKVYGRTDLPFTIKGLRLIPGKGFPEGAPAIEVHGKAVLLKNLDLKGFKTGILFASQNNENHEVVGGRIRTKEGASQAILSCRNAPLVEGTKISGYSEKVSVINQ